MFQKHKDEKPALHMKTVLSHLIFINVYYKGKGEVNYLNQYCTPHNILHSKMLYLVNIRVLEAVLSQPKANFYGTNTVY